MSFYLFLFSVERLIVNRGRYDPVIIGDTISVLSCLQMNKSNRFKE